MVSTITMNTALPQTMHTDVAQRVEPGDDGNTSEDARGLIRQGQAAQRAQRLCGLVEAGLASGPAVADTQADRNELMAIARGSLG